MTDTPPGNNQESDLTKGSRWRRAGWRGVWVLESAGAKYVTLKPTIPGFKRHKMERVEFLASDWQQV